MKFIYCLLVLLTSNALFGFTFKQYYCPSCDFLRAFEVAETEQENLAIPSALIDQIDALNLVDNRLDESNFLQLHRAFEPIVAQARTLAEKVFPADNSQILTLTKFVHDHSYWDVHKADLLPYQLTAEQILPFVETFDPEVRSYFNFPADGNIEGPNVYANYLAIGKKKHKWEVRDLLFSDGQIGPEGRSFLRAALELKLEEGIPGSLWAGDALNPNAIQFFAQSMVRLLHEHNDYIESRDFSSQAQSLWGESLTDFLKQRVFELRPSFTNIFLELFEQEFFLNKGGFTKEGLNFLVDLMATTLKGDEDVLNMNWATAEEIIGRYQTNPQWQALAEQRVIGNQMDAIARYFILVRNFRLDDQLEQRVLDFQGKPYSAAALITHLLWRVMVWNPEDAFRVNNTIPEAISAMNPEIAELDMTIYGMVKNEIGKLRP